MGNYEDVDGLTISVESMESRKAVLRICWVVPDLERYNKMWSMQNLFSDWSVRNDVDLTVVEYGKRNDSPLLRYLDVISKFLYVWQTSQDFLYRSIYRRKLKRELNKYNKFDVLFFPAFLNVIDEIENKGSVCLYTDTLLSEMNAYRRYKPFKHISSFFFLSNIKKDSKKIDLLFCQNEWTARCYSLTCKVPKSKIFNVHFGVNLKLYDGDKDYLQHRMLIVLRKGKERLKGCTLLLKAMPLIREVYNDAVLDIVGTDYGANVEGVVCHYNQPRSTTIELFKQATLYVMPSHNEPNGVTFLEGLACKAPIVGLNRYAFPEFCGYGEWGFIVEEETPECLAKTVCEAFSNPGRLYAMGINGQKYVEENFIWSKTSERMIELMRTLTGKK